MSWLPFTLSPALPRRPRILTIRKIGVGDLKQALIKGWDDFAAYPSQAIFIVLIYPIVGFILGRMALGSATLPLLFPLIAGFALVGPIAAVGLYELYQTPRARTRVVVDPRIRCAQKAFDLRDCRTRHRAVDTILCVDGGRAIDLSFALQPLRARFRYSIS